MVQVVAKISEVEEEARSESSFDMIPVVEASEIAMNEMKKRSEDSNKKFMFYPENSFLSKWTIFMVIVLITTCMLTPVELAFAVDGD